MRDIFTTATDGGHKPLTSRLRIVEHINHSVTLPQLHKQKQQQEQQAQQQCRLNYNLVSRISSAFLIDRPHGQCVKREQKPLETRLGKPNILSLIYVEN